MKFGAPAICTAVLAVVTAIDCGIRREASVVATLAGAVGIPCFAMGTPPSIATREDAPQKPHARIEITPLSKPSSVVQLRSINGAEVESFEIFTDGDLDLKSGPALKRFMRCRRTGRELALAPGVLAMLVSVAQQWPGRIIDVVSAFRSPPFGVPHSKHFLGHAIDLRVEGVKTAKLRDFIWRTHHEVGVGFYLEEDFVHMDWRPGEPDMAWSAIHEGDPADYNPRWAWSARHASSQKVCETGCT
jgi:uncharacterized protein YcbK (DUF882 family)